MDVDKKTQEMLLQTLYRMKEEQYKFEQRREARLWKTFKTPINLRNLLSYLTMDELSEIRQNLELPGLSALRKNELINALKTGILNSAYRVFNLFDDLRYQFVKKIVNNDGLTVRIDLDKDQVNYFRSRGIIFTGCLNGKRALAIPFELISE